MSEQCNATSQQCSEVNSLNAKLAYDSAAQLQHQSLVNNQANASAWQAFNLSVAQDAQIVKHLATLGLIQAGQTGFTENQSLVTPVRSSTGDAIVGGVGVAGEQVAANVANLVTALTPGIVEAVTTAIAALLPTLVTAAGGASTPSQTQAKP